MSPRRELWIVAVVASALACGDHAPARSHDAGHGAASDAAPAAAVPSAPPTTITPTPGPHIAQYTAPVVNDPISLDEPTIALPKQESFRLIDAGAKTGRAKLRYTLAAGTATYTTATALTSRHLSDAQQATPVSLGTIRDGFTLTIAAGQPHRLALRALTADAQPASAEADAYLATWRGLLQGRTITVTVDDRGQLSALTFNDDPANARGARAKDELTQRLLATLVPLPAEPIAPGASWRVVTILRQGPAYTKQTATYTLTAKTASSWKLHLKLQRVGEPQRLRDPSLPPGTTAELVGLFRELEGDVELAPSVPWIATGSLTIESRLHARLTPPGATPGAEKTIEQVFEDTGTARFSRAP
jgi:hypothetical protein